MAPRRPAAPPPAPWRPAARGGGLARARSWCTMVPPRTHVRAEALSLTDGSRIAVIGAGPAGTFFALFFSRLARRRGLQVTVTLFDWKDFGRRGPQGCNLCAGVISETLVRRLKASGIVLPGEKVQRKIEGYFLQTKAGGFLLRHPEGQKRITTVFRGNGPRFSGQRGNISFDDFLLEQVRTLDNVEVITEPVRGLRYTTAPDPAARPASFRLPGPMEVSYGREGSASALRADLVVGACGLNTAMLQRIQKLGFGYRPPKTLHASCLEIPMDGALIRQRLGDNIFIANWRTSGGMRIAGIIPKKNYLTVNVVGRSDVRRTDLEEFLGLASVRERLQGSRSRAGRSCSCYPRIATTAARRPFADRLVIIGDASCARYYKNGIESAWVTAHLAAETAVSRGISARAFRRGYLRRARRMIIRDNLFGRLLFRFYNLVYESAFFSEVLLHQVRAEQKGGSRRYLGEVLWNMYTGNVSYARILRSFLRPAVQGRLIAATFAAAAARLRARLAPARGSGRP